MIETTRCHYDNSERDIEDFVSSKHIPCIDNLNGIKSGKS